MEIIEQTIVPKDPTRKSEDGIVVTPDFIAVIDGSTSKTDRRYSFFNSNGRYAMLLIEKYLKKAPKDITCEAFCREITRRFRKEYKRALLPHLTEHPEDRLTASCIIFSRVSRQIWMIGDCQCIVGSEYYDNPKPYEQELAQQRAAIIKASPEPHDHFLEDDTARAAIIPRMKETMKQQNVTYAVVDGFPIPMQHVRIITLDFRPWQIVLASDGYPFLCPTLEASEARLAEQRTADPLNIGDFKATKAFKTGNNSFDDRAYIRFKA
jgi:glycerophosphoryl diester phosphodiesterase